MSNKPKRDYNECVAAGMAILVGMLAANPILTTPKDEADRRLIASKAFDMAESMLDEAARRYPKAEHDLDR